MKRIAYIGPTATEDPSGVAGMARELLLALTDLGCEVDCFLSGTAIELPDSLAGVNNLQVVAVGTRWRWGAWYSRVPLAAFVTGQAVRAWGFHQLGAEIEKRHLERPYDAIYQFSQIELFGLAHRVKRLPPVVLHPEVHMAGELRAFIRERRLARQTSSVFTLLAVLLMLVSRTVLQRRHLRHARWVVCPSRAFEAALLRDAPFLRGRTMVVPNVINTRFYAGRSAARTRSTGRNVIYVGRISVRKGVPDVVRLGRELPDHVSLEVFGGHSLWSDYRKLLDPSGPTVTYHGAQSPEVIREAMQRSDVLVQPSTYEPFGLTVAEGLACGAFVVAYDAVGAAEDLPQTVASRVATGDYDALKSAVGDALVAEHDPDASRAVAVQLFGPAAFRTHLATVLDAL